MPAGNYTKTAEFSQEQFIEAVMPRAREVARAVWRDPESAMPYERSEARRGTVQYCGRWQMAEARGLLSAISRPAVRVFSEVKRRTRLMGAFRNEKSCTLVFFAVIQALRFRMIPAPEILHKTLPKHPASSPS